MKRAAGGSDARTEFEASHDPAEEPEDYDDPFGDEFAEEEMVEGMDEGGMEDEDEDGAAPRMFRAGVDALGEGEVLEFDPSAYIMYHHLKSEWPCLSFDILRDDLGGNRTRFPMTMFAVAGSQAEAGEANKLTVLKLDRLSRIKAPREEEDSEAVLDLEDDDEPEDEPILDSIDVPHPCGTNRLRCCPAKPALVATMGEDARVRIFDLAPNPNP